MTTQSDYNLSRPIPEILLTHIGRLPSPSQWVNLILRDTRNLPPEERVRLIKGLQNPPEASPAEAPKPA